MSYFNEGQVKQDIADAKRLIELRKTNLDILNGQLSIMRRASSSIEPQSGEFFASYQSAMNQLSDYIESLEGAERIRSGVIDRDLLAARCRNARYKDAEEEMRALEELAALGYDEATVNLGFAYCVWTYRYRNDEFVDERNPLADMNKAEMFYEKAKLLGNKSIDELAERIANSYEKEGNAERQLFGENDKPKRVPMIERK